MSSCFPTRTQPRVSSSAPEATRLLSGRSRARALVLSFSVFFAFDKLECFDKWKASRGCKVIVYGCYATVSPSLAEVLFEEKLEVVPVAKVRLLHQATEGTAYCPG